MDGWGLLQGGMYVPSLKKRKKKVLFIVESALNILSSYTSLQAPHSNNYETNDSNRT